MKFKRFLTLSIISLISFNSFGATSGRVEVSASTSTLETTKSNESSSNEQITDRQFKLLVDSCDRIMAETISAKDIQRPVYQSTIDLLNEGDTLVISSIDRAFRNTMDALSEADKLRARGVHFQILNLARGAVAALTSVKEKFTSLVELFSSIVPTYDGFMNNIAEIIAAAF